MPSEDIALLAHEFKASAGNLERGMYPAFKEAGQEFVKGWRANARATSGKHGRHYPNSITTETVMRATGVVVDVGPVSSRPQGGMGMGFEFGSRNQPAHLDGAKAMIPAAQQLQALATRALGDLLP